MDRSVLKVVPLALLATLAIACGESCPQGEVLCDGLCIPEIGATLDDIQADVFDGSCVASPCHDDSNPAEMLSLASVAVSRNNLIDVVSVQSDKVRVAPGVSDESYLMDKLLGVELGLTSGGQPSDRMPQGFPPLCQAKIDAVRAWINAGAD